MTETLLVTAPDGSADHPESAKTESRYVLLDFDVVRTYGLSPQAGWLYACLKSFADYETGEAWPSKETLAILLQLTQGRSVDKYVAELCGHGLITRVRHRYCDPGDKRDWVLDQPDDVHTAQTSNLYVVNMRPESSQVTGGCAPAHGGGVPQRMGGVRPSAHEQQSPTNNHLPTSLEQTSAEKTSDGAAAPADEFSARLIERKRVNGEKTSQPKPLHPQWQPNNANCVTAKKLGVDLDLAVEQFRETMFASGQRRRCWGSTFGKFLKAMAEQDTAQFGVSTEELVATSVTRALKNVQPSARTPQTPGSPIEPETRNNRDETSATIDESARKRSANIDGPYRFKSAVWALEEEGYRGASVRDRARELFDAGTSTASLINLLKQEFVPDLEPLTA